MKFTDSWTTQAAGRPTTCRQTRGEEYTDQGQDYYEQRYRECLLHALSQRAAKLGMKMVAIEQPA